MNIVSAAITSGRLPKASNAVYFVFTAADVTESNSFGAFCSKFCGWHDHASIAGTDIKYAFVGNPSRCITTCAEQAEVSPNANPAPTRWRT